jgi:hypothetical protein
MSIFGTFTPTKVAIGLSTAILGSSAFYCLVKFGGGSKLFQIWFERTIRAMSRSLHQPDPVGEFISYLTDGADDKTRVRTIVLL